jgi:hypothetical protein
MASNDYDIVNKALIRLGAKTITALNDGSNNANVANEIYADTRDDLLRTHEWGFAEKVSALSKVEANVLTITDVTQADPGVVTYTGTDPENGDKYKITAVVGMTELNGNTYVVSSVNTSADTFELKDEAGADLDTSGYTAYGSAGTATQQDFDYENMTYLFTPPTGMLRALWINGDPELEFESTKEGIKCNYKEVELTYIYQETDVTQYDPNFVDTFAWKLASEMAVKITGSTKKSDWAEKRFLRSRSQSTTMDAKEEHHAKSSQYDRYKNSRR